MAHSGLLNGGNPAAGGSAAVASEASAYYFANQYNDGKTAINPETGKDDVTKVSKVPNDNIVGESSLDNIDFSGGKPTLPNDSYAPDITNQRSAEFYAQYGDNPTRGTLSNIEARQWYVDQEKRIPDLIDKTLSLEDQAKQSFDLRNSFRTDARTLMQDRITADRLFSEETNITWEQLVNKTSTKLSQQGITPSSDKIYQEIIKSSQRSRSSVNKALGVK